MNLKSKVAIITGGSSGIGKASAITLAKYGAEIILIYNKNSKGAKNTEKEIKKINGDCTILQADLSDINNIPKIIEEAIEIYSGIDILVNNAGDNLVNSFLNESIKNLDYMLTINLKSVFFLSQLASKEMIKRKNGGSIINISSISGLVVSEGISSYCTSKAAVNMLTKCMAFELAKYNIRVNAILPGSIDTPLLRKLATQEVLNKEIELTPLKRLGIPEDISETVAFLASDYSKFMTGSLIVIDGGYMV